jgi:hypothetical protein
VSQFHNQRRLSTDADVGRACHTGPMVVPKITDAELRAIEARNDPRDISRLVAALKKANADLANPFRLEKAWRKLTVFLRHVDLFHSVDALARLCPCDFSGPLVEDCTALALRRGFIMLKAPGRLELTKRGARLLPKVTESDL